jgi:hypothetical protein
VITAVKPQLLLNINRLGSVAETKGFPMSYKLGFNILEEDILHSHRRENLLHSINRLGFVAAT